MEINLKSENVKLRPLVEDDLLTIKRWRSNFSLKRLTGPGPFLPTLSQQVSLTRCANGNFYALNYYSAKLEDLF